MPRKGGLAPPPAHRLYDRHDDPRGCHEREDRCSAEVRVPDADRDGSDECRFDGQACRSAEPPRRPSRLEVREVRAKPRNLALELNLILWGGARLRDRLGSGRKPELLPRSRASLFTLGG